MSNDREFVKLNVERNSLSQIKYIAELTQEKFEDTANRIIYDGLLLNQIDPTVKKELLKRQKLHKILIDFYEILRNSCQYNPQIVSISLVTQHFYADYSPFLLKKNLTEFDKLVISKGQEFFKCLKEEFKDDFETFKKSVTLQHRTKQYKNIFDFTFDVNAPPSSPLKEQEGNVEIDFNLLKNNLKECDEDGTLSHEHWTHDISDMANNIMTVPKNYREEKFQNTIEIIHKKYGYDVKYEDYLRKTLNYAVDKKQLSAQRR